MKEVGIYIHIPFCKKKCEYCDFLSYANKAEKVEEYVKCVKEEIEKTKIKEDEKISSIYFGGGTPSFIDSKFITEIMQEVKETFSLKEDEKIETTIEINPGTITAKKLGEYKKCGINRVSIGLQETDDALLKQIGRIHTYEDFLKTYNLAVEAGFNNINVDLMIGLPNQTIDNIKESLEKIKNLKEVKHISVYSLIVEENTVMAKKLDQKIYHLPEEEVERKMYWYVKDTLEKNGFIQYEISNFAKRQKESKHNLDCWRQKQYLGFGIGSHSYYNKVRYSNTDNMQEYIDCIKENRIDKIRQIHEKQNIEDEQKEYMLLGLRTLKGVSIKSFKEKFVQNPVYVFRKELSKLEQEKLIVIDDDDIKLTKKGLDLANLVWEEFV